MVIGFLITIHSFYYNNQLKKIQQINLIKLNIEKITSHYSNLEPLNKITKGNYI
jgi:hypothetical protein